MQNKCKIDKLLLLIKIRECVFNKVIWIWLKRGPHITFFKKAKRDLKKFILSSICDLYTTIYYNFTLYLVNLVLRSKVREFDPGWKSRIFLELKIRKASPPRCRPTLNRVSFGLLHVKELHIRQRSLDKIFCPFQVP